MASGVQLSVALVTRNRPDLLDRCLASVRAQSLQPLEVIVADDSGSEHVQRTRQVASMHGCTYHPGPRRGLYANRNFVAQQCCGTHIRTMDDDHILPTDHFQRCLAAVQGDPRAIWTTGETGFLEGKLVWRFETANRLGPAGVGCPIEDRDDNWGIADGSTIYPREVFDRGFRMVEDFGFGASYLEFGAYLYRHGWKCRCIPAAAVEHHTKTVNLPNPASHLFASICFNQYFQPQKWRLIRHMAPYWRSWVNLPYLFETARCRWAVS